VEKRLNTWCNRWLSQGGRLVLVKAVLKQYQYIDFIGLGSKGVLEIIRKLCYKFICSGDQKKKGLVLASWKKLVVPKASGGWGLKIPFSSPRL
jgi:hypothetical protein